MCSVVTIYACGIEPAVQGSNVGFYLSTGGSGFS